MNILLLGSGGREHALAWKISQSPLCDNLYVAPSSDAIDLTISNANHAKGLTISDQQSISDFCLKHDISLVVVGPEQPLVDGMADHLTKHNIAVFGCSQQAAQLEGSKAFLKDFCTKYGIKTANYKSFTATTGDNCHVATAKQYLQSDNNFPIVIKASGLAAGKGVIIANNHDEAITAIDKLSALEGGKTLVIEDFLQGREISFFAISDGSQGYFIGTAQDYKRAFDNDKGENTGGMGAFSPSPMEDKAFIDKVMADFIQPTITGMQQQGTPYKGILYAGLMVSDNGDINLLEYNIRFGDPECQTLMLRLENDIVPLLYAIATDATITEAIKPKINHQTQAMTVIYASEGYPNAYQKGSIIRGLDSISDDVMVFHAGTKHINGCWQANGGRVLNITHKGEALEEVRKTIYQNIAKIDWQQGFYRTDIATVRTCNKTMSLRTYNKTHGLD